MNAYLSECVFIFFQFYRSDSYHREQREQHQQEGPFNSIVQILSWTTPRSLCLELPFNSIVQIPTASRTRTDLLSRSAFQFYRSDSKGFVLAQVGEFSGNFQFYRSDSGPRVFVFRPQFHKPAFNSIVQIRCRATGGRGLSRTRRFQFYRSDSTGPAPPGGETSTASFQFYRSDSHAPVLHSVSKHCDLSILSFRFQQLLQRWRSHSLHLNFQFYRSDSLS